jgi:uncharacterized YigZ family protein
MSEPEAPRLIPAARATVEIRVSNSRFVATAGPTGTVAEARAFIAAARAALPDASHHVYAYRIGHGASTTEGQSDAGEPPGTAGRPALAVVRGSGLGDVTVVITRYFGGALLGTGGLVRAYGDATKAVLAAVPRAVKIAYARLTIGVPYGAYEGATRQIAAHAGVILHEDFAAAVTLDVRLPAAEAPGLIAALRESTAGQARVTTQDDADPASADSPGA